ncbi:MAG: DUF2752 domain-containing protein [Bacilli bacterium]
MKRIYNILILFFGTTFILIMTSGLIKYSCIFKKIIGIRCPGCGLTRSFRAIINLDFYNAPRYNILGIPLFIICIIFFISITVDIIRNKNNTILFINKIFKKYYILIIILLGITTIINNINGI